MFVDSLIEDLLKALDGSDFYNPFGEIEDQEIDPVLRVTDPTPSTATHEIESFAPVRHESDRPFYDRMTTTKKEEKVINRIAGQMSDPGSSGSFRAAEEGSLPRPKKKGLTTDQFVLRMLNKEGKEYEWGGTTAGGGFDCSGIVWRIMTNAGYENYPRHSSAIYEHSKKISLKKAINTRGALLYTEGHMAISLGNGKTIEAMGEDYGVVKGNAHGRFKYGGLLPELTPSKRRNLAKAMKKAPRGRRRVEIGEEPKTTSLRDITQIASPIAGLQMAMGNVLGGLEPQAVVQPRGRGIQAATPAGMKGVKAQLYAGFMEAGRPDLAKMVRTKAFDTWIGQESGWRKDATSPANNQGLANDGLFQIWRGHDYNSNGEVAKMSAYEQAMLVARYFPHLTPEKIRGYAAAIRNGTYKGWG